MEKYPIFQICRTAGFKIDWYIPKPETFCELSGERPLQYYNLLHLRNFSVFYSIFSLQSLIVTNDLRIWTPRTRWISRTSWTPDFFVSGKVKLLKVIKTDSVINITRVYTEIFPNADKKKRRFLPTKERYSSVRCVILKDKARCLKILRKTLLEFVFLGYRFQYKRDYNILLFQNTANHCFNVQDCIQNGKIGKGTFDHGKISNFSDL